MSATLCAVTPHPSDRPGIPDPGTPPFFLNGAVSDAAMSYFYAHLFASEPEISAMFPAAMHVQRQRFYRVLCRIVAAAAVEGAQGAEGPGPADDGEFARYLRSLGRAHRKFGARSEHYASFRRALRATVGKFAPGSVPGARDAPAAWEIAFDRAAEIMTGAADEDAASGAPAWWTAEVTGHELRTPQVAVLTVRPAEPFPHLPGQHLSVQTPRWPRLWRSYSIANAPRADGMLTLHVRAVAGGLVSTTLVHHVRIGDMLLLGPSEGPMTADTQSRRPVLCMAGGTGLAPLKAIAEAIAGSGAPGAPGAAGAAGERREVVLYYGARSESELYDLPALRQMEREFPGLEVIPVTSQERAAGTRHGTIPAVAAQARWEDRDVYISGPDPMIAETVAVLRELGARSELLHFDLPEQIT